MTYKSLDSPLRSVLIVDQSEDSREVIRLALERKGMEIHEASSARHGLDLVRRHHPGVVVLDLEAEEADDTEVRGQYDDQTLQNNSSLVILGTVTLKSASHTPAESQTQFVAKPYHYGPLIRTIEQLLEGSKVTESNV